MADKKEEGYCGKIADAGLLRLVSRICIPVIAAVCVWVLTSVQDMSKALVGLAEKLDGKVATLEAQFNGVDKRTGTLEDWRNQMDAAASENTPRRGNGI